MRIALTGVKHSGKSTVAREIATLTGQQVLDTDDLICRTYNVDSPRALFHRDGAGRFREAELKIVETLGQTEGDDLVLATGGGIADNGVALAKLTESFTLVYLAEDPSVLYDRIMTGGRPPFLPEEGTYLAFLRLFRRRDRTYRRWATLTYPVQGESVARVAEGILRKLRSS